MVIDLTETVSSHELVQKSVRNFSIKRCTEATTKQVEAPYFDLHLSYFQPIQHSFRFGIQITYKYISMEHDDDGREIRESRYILTGPNVLTN